MSFTTEELMRLFAEYSADLFSIHTVDGIYTYVSPAVKRLFGYEPDELIGHSPYDYFHPDDKQAIRLIHRVQIQVPEALAITYRMRCKDGSYLWVESSSRTVRDPETGDPKMIVTSTRDASVRKRAELDLLESEAMLKSFYNTCPLYMGVVDVEGDTIRYVSTNPRTAELYNMDPQSLAGQETRAAPEVRGLWLHHYRESERTGQPSQFEFPMGNVWHRAVAAFLGKRANGVSRFCFVASDITDLRRAEEQALEASRLKSEFLANMSHEIRTPLNGVLGAASLLASSDLTQEQREHVQVIHESVTNLMGIINDVLDFSKVEAGRLELESIDFDASELAREIERAHRPVAQGKGLSFHLELGEGAESCLRGDPGRVRQILHNLVGNAVKFTLKGGIRILVSSEAVGENRRRLRMIVEDTGVGIPESQRERIFTAFAQGDASTTRRFGGSGLGLSISKRLAEVMGGTLSLESTEGQGSRFEFEASFEVGLGRPAQAPKIRSTCGARGKVLVVEDHAINRRVAARILENLGYEADAVANGEEAVDAFSRGQYDLILMDCQMPEMDGFEATRRIRKLERGERVAIVGFTAAALKPDIEKCMEAGMDDFIPKPASLEAIAEKLNKWLSGGSPRSPN